MIARRTRRLLSVTAAGVSFLWISGAAAQAPPAPSPSPRAAHDSALRSPDTLVINVAGDIAYPNDWGGINHIDEQQHQLFALVQPILDSGDINFANIECPLTDNPATVDKEFPIACKQKRLDYVVDAGFNLLSLANNHSRDAGQSGIEDTLDLLARKNTDERPLWWGGTGRTADEARGPTIFTPPGKTSRVAFFAVANTGASGTVGSIHDRALPERIKQATERADIVIVSVHFGPEYVHVPWKGAVTKYHALIDAGADLVVAHHPHVVQGVERYGDGFIFYSLGNFSFGSKTRRHLQTGARLYSMIGRVTFRGSALHSVELIPLYANNAWKWTIGDKTLEPRHATPQLVGGAFAHAALDEFEAFTRDVPTDTPSKLFRIGDRGFVDLGTGPPGPRDIAISLHEQRHEYANTAELGALPRNATDAEKRVQGRGGTPEAAVRSAQLQAKKQDQRKKRGKARKDRKKARKAKSRAKGSARRGKR